MAIVINGSGTVTGLAVGGLPDGTVDNDTVASGLASSKLTGALPAISGASLTNVPSVNPNILINGGFDVAQRGTTISGIGSSKYTLDRWEATSSGADSTVTQVSGATYPKALRLTGAGSTTGTYLKQKVESVNSRHLAGQTATFSVYLRASTAKTVEFSIKYATSTDNFGGTTSIATTNFSVTTTDTKFTWTGSIPSAAITGIQVQLKISSQGSAWYEASNAKLEIGSLATDFEPRGYGEELALCQRYYEKSFNQGTAVGTATAVGSIYTGVNDGSNTTGYLGGTHSFRVSKRTNPTLVVYDTAGNSGKCQRDNFGTNNSTNQDCTIGNSSESMFLVYSSGTHSASTLVYHFTADAEL